jgi:hypothetical protein
MTDSFFPPVRMWNIPATVLSASLAEMAGDGVRGNEGIMLWVGRRWDSIAEITHLIALRGPGVSKRPDHIHIESWLFNEITDVVIELNAVLIGQIHSHGPGATTALSDTDRAYGISAPYYLSVVAPGYGLRSTTGLQECGVHVFEPGSGYRCLSATEGAERLHVIAGPSLPVLTVGEER